jgi:hypothetical protein
MYVFYAILLFLGPRLACLIYWFYLSEFVHQVFNGWFWPLLGVIFLPWSTGVYVMAHTAYDQSFGGWDWLWLGIAFAVDMATNYGAVYFRVKGGSAVNAIKWIEQSTALRIRLYLLILFIGLFAGIYFSVAAILGGAGASAESWVQFLTLVFLVYLFLGFLFSFVEPTKLWLPALLLCAPAVPLVCFLSPALIIFVGLAAGAATLGAYLGALLLKTGKDKGSLGV